MRSVTTFVPCQYRTVSLVNRNTVIITINYYSYFLLKNIHVRSIQVCNTKGEGVNNIIEKHSK